MAGPDRSRGSTRQVTTATPAKLDFRGAEATDEGCADAMSTESACSIASGSMRLKPATGIATRKRREFGVIPASDIQRFAVRYTKCLISRTGSVAGRSIDKFFGASNRTCNVSGTDLAWPSAV